MSYQKGDLKDTTLPTIIVPKSKFQGLEAECPQIGFGEEGAVYRYEDRYALKTFEFFENVNKLPQKFKKLESLAKLSDPSFCIPKGLFGYEDAKKEGYFMELVKTHAEYKNFFVLQWKLHNLRVAKEAIIYLKKAEEAIKRIHAEGVIIGDIRGDNILIDEEGNPRFIDVDNYAYDGFSFDLEPSRARWYEETFAKEGTMLDNDKYVFALLALQILFPKYPFILCKGNYFFERFIRSIQVSKEAKEGLRLLLSDALDKPYFSEVLDKMDLEGELFSLEDDYWLRRILR